MSIPNSLRQVKITTTTNLAIVRLIFFVLDLEGEKTETEVNSAWERMVGRVGKVTWGKFADAFSDSTMLMKVLEPMIGGLPVDYIRLFKALSVVDPWTPMSEDGYFGIVESGNGFRVLEAGKACPYGQRRILVASNIPTTHWAWTSGLEVSLSEEGDRTYGSDPVSYDPAVLLDEGLVVHERFQTAMDHYGVPLIWVLNTLFNAPEARTNFTVPYEAMEFIGKPTMRSQNDIDRFVYMAKQAMERGQMYVRRSTESDVDTMRLGTLIRDYQRPPISLRAMESLIKLLYTLFSSSTEELRSFVRFGEQGSEVSLVFPGENASMAKHVEVILNELEKRGLINANFFNRLTGLRSRRVEEINAVRRQFGV